MLSAVWEYVCTDLFMTVCLRWVFLTLSPILSVDRGEKASKRLGEPITGLLRGCTEHIQSSLLWNDQSRGAATG